MSLQVWLPLTKDLRNQGLNEATIINSGATYSSTGGKLGGCYVFDGVDDALSVGNLFTMVDTDFSFTCWFYKDEWGSKGYETIFGGSSGFELESKVGATNSPVLKLYNWGGGSCTYELSKWNHIVFTRNTTETKLYLNGELKVTGTAGTIPNHEYFVGAWNSATQQNFKGKMCDVRIYDHCLSEMEIKQLSQGLVLHYPLNRQGFGQENLFRANPFSGGARWTSIKNGRGVKIDWTSNAGDTYFYFNLGTGVTLTQGNTYTLSFQCSGIGSSVVSFYWCNLSGNSSMRCQLKNGLNVLTFQMPSNNITKPFFDDIERDTSLSNLQMWNFKLEEGSIATPWCPNSSDTIATSMGLNGTTEYDCSGFCNNGTRTGTFSWTSDTPKYSVSTKFNGSECILRNSPDADIYTLTCWAKTSKSKNTAQFMIADSNSKLSISFYNGNIISYFYGNSAGIGSKCILGTEYKENEWNFFAVVKTGENTRDCYCNGVKLTPTSNDWWSTAAGFFVGNRSSGGNGPFYGEISDVRAYATALSADDVKSLYQNSAYIDSSGNIYGAVHTEV